MSWPSNKSNLKKQFLEFKQNLGLDLPNSLEVTRRQEDKDKAALLRMAIDQAGERASTPSLGMVCSVLRDPRWSTTSASSSRPRRPTSSARTSRSCPDLMTDSRDEQSKDEIKRTQKLLEDLKEEISARSASAPRPSAAAATRPTSRRTRRA